MRIAIVSDFFYPELSGIADSITLLGQTLAKRGHQIMFIVPYYSQKNYRQANDLIDKNYGPNITIKHLPALTLPSSPTGQSRLVLPSGLAYFALKNFKPDIIHSHSQFIPGLEALLTARSLKIPLVGTNHTPLAEYLPRRPRFLIKLILAYSAWYYNRCIFVSAPCQTLLEEMAQAGFKINLAKVISNPVDLNNYQPVETEDLKNKLKQQFGLSAQTLLYTGRLADEKQIGVIIQALKLLIFDFPNLDLVIVGRGRAEQALRLLTTNLQLNDRVKYLGFVKKETLTLIYQAADLFVIMSPVETQSLSLMQAMASALPVIGAQARALPEYINTTNGRLVETGDAIALAKTIKEILEQPQLANDLGQGGLKSVINYAPTIISETWEKIYQKLIAQKS
ncbi:MAG: hypothetical protein COX02_01620 [Candidatus Vogelbacteria bacterium CG22_combo_CG10-13_8_21_14_all_37_9]|uniref:Glycosyl transferase family 1 n=1 Tax=Candidatus Vogelbacteria bacterium CG22_combo_CG10-13_8_21_14_all_37_9 TaxID=1975046 RepID=A0A2H0BKI1_9BACT|nr:MAG: hypothetical protein BK005_00535 [bacterium CG10_37_50]PIP58186.1 MAG: hypothetical protein COX02_01620 [Candidatus Vogelbacteria bacterium CG22_combo_CG10-13_8_21_14_all_37_9]